MGRAGLPEEVAAVVWLLGSGLVRDGGTLDVGGGR